MAVSVGRASRCSGRIGGQEGGTKLPHSQACDEKQEKEKNLRPFATSGVAARKARVGRAWALAWMTLANAIGLVPLSEGRPKVFLCSNETDFLLPRTNRSRRSGGRESSET